MLLAAHLAGPRKKPVFRDLRFDRRNIHRLMTPVQACGSDLAAALTLPGRIQKVRLIDLLFREKGPTAPNVPGLASGFLAALKWTPESRQ